MCSKVRVDGLETLYYVDNLMNRSRFTEQADAIIFDGDVGIIKHQIKFFTLAIYLDPTLLK
jgi:hypothetical protein